MTTALSTIADLSPVIQTLATTVATVVLALGAIVVHKINVWLGAKTGHQNLINEDMVRGYLHNALDGAVHYAVSQAGSANWSHPDVKNALIKEAIDYAEQRVPDAIAYFKLDADDLEKLITAKLSQLLPAAPTPTS